MKYDSNKCDGSLSQQSILITHKKLKHERWLSPVTVPNIFSIVNEMQLFMPIISVIAVLITLESLKGTHNPNTVPILIQLIKCPMIIIKHNFL